MTAITLAYGDGSGPEHMEAVLLALREAEARLTFEVIEIGERIYQMQGAAGILPSAWESLERTRLLLTAPAGAPLFEGQEPVEAALAERFSLHTRAHLHPDSHPLGPLMIYDNAAGTAAYARLGDDFALFTTAPGAPPQALADAALLLLLYTGQTETARRLQRSLCE